ncbi:hypothetical protein JZU71_05185, partial [bacterium]|nr:hypothetical protein [bacterium]
MILQHKSKKPREFWLAGLQGERLAATGDKGEEGTPAVGRIHPPKETNAKTKEQEHSPANEEGKQVCLFYRRSRVDRGGRSVDRSNRLLLDWRRR